MNMILLKDPITDTEQEQLLSEFPQYKLTITKKELDPNIAEQCSLVEIVYGHQFTAQELDLTPQLRWIHVTTPYVDEICMDRIREKGNILVTTTKEENIVQIGEYALSAILAFSKNLFRWRDATHDLIDEEMNLLCQTMWRASNRTLLQVGLGIIGTEIARRASEFGFRVLGIQDPPSFHPYCHKVLSMKDIHSVLPASDIVCLATPRDDPADMWFTMEEMDLLKDDSILLVLGNGEVIDIHALEKVAKTPKLRGVLIDARLKHRISAKSPLWDFPHVIVTHDIGTYPQADEGASFRTFVFNLRQFLHSNFTDMKNLVDKTEASQLIET